MFDLERAKKLLKVMELDELPWRDEPGVCGEDWMSVDFWNSHLSIGVVHGGFACCHLREFVKGGDTWAWSARESYALLKKYGRLAKIAYGMK